MVEVGPALNLNRHLQRITSLITSVAGLIVTLAAISTQPVMTLLGGSISSTIAWIITLAAFYYVTTIGFGWVIVVFSIFCASIGVMGPPITFLQSLIGPTLPEPRVEYVDPNYVAKSTPKKNLLARIQNSIGRLPFRIILFILAITDTILSTTFFEEGKHKRNRFWDLLFEEKEEFYDYEQVYGGKVVNNHPDELWIYINGINCYLEDGKEECMKMYKMFGRPVKLLHNPTDGTFLDIMECMMGKTGLLRHCFTRPRDFLKDVLGKEMKKDDYKKIVLVAHSQGTIITGNVIADFNDIVDGTTKFNEEDRAVLKNNMSKMEVYMVASAAHYVSGKHVSHLECLSNRGDFVAFFGHLFPKILKPFWLNTRRAGIHYEDCNDHVEKSAWGHLLDLHYLTPIEKGSFPGSKLATSYLLRKPKDESATETSKLLS